MKKQINILVSILLVLVMITGIMPIAAAAESEISVTVIANGLGGTIDCNSLTVDSNHREGSGEFSSATSITIKATPREGYSFAGWYSMVGFGSFSPLSTANPYTFTVTESMYIVAEYKSIGGVWVGGKLLTNGKYLSESGNVGTTALTDNYAYYNNGVLTLHNYDYTGEGYEVDPYSNRKKYALIYTENDIRINLKGKNTLRYSGNDKSVDGIITGGSLNISGIGPASLALSGVSYGIVTDDINQSDESNRDISIDNCKLQITTEGNSIEAYGALKIGESTIIATASDGYGLSSFDGTIAISDSVVDVAAKQTGIWAINDKATIENSEVTVSSGSNGISGSTLEIKNSTVAVTSELNALGVDNSNRISVEKSNMNIKSTNTEKDDTYRAAYADGFTLGEGLNIQASTDANGTLGGYTAANHNTYDYITITAPAPTTCTVTFNTDGGSSVAMQTVNVGAKATKPTDPTRNGYTFKGWTLYGTAYDFSSTVTKDITIRANWEAKQTLTVIDQIHIGGVTMPVVGAIPVNSATTSTPGVVIREDSFWVRYVPESNDLKDLYDDNTSVDDTPFRSGVTYFLQILLGPKAGYTIDPNAKIFFGGVQLGAPDESDLSKSFAMVDPSGELAAAYIGGKASELTTYTVTFDSNGGSAVTAQTVQEGKTAIKPADPVREGYTFMGWTLNGSNYDFSANITKSITLKAKWEVTPTASVIDQIHISGVTMPAVGTMPVNSVTLSTPGVAIGGDTFWVRYVPETNDLKDTYDDNTFVDDTPFRSGIKYFLQVILEPQNGCSIAPNAKIFYNGIQLAAPDESDLSKSCAMVKPDGTMAMVLISGETAATETYTVSFDSDGGSAVTAQTIESGKSATKPADPTKNGYIFKGWKLGNTDYDFNSKVTGNITLVAIWEVKPTDPTDTTEPTDTSEPTETTEPTNPTDTTEPGNSTDVLTTVPTAETVTTTAEITTQPTTNNSGESSTVPTPTTPAGEGGGNSLWWIWIVIAVVAVGSIAFIIFWARKNKKQ